MSDQNKYINGYIDNAVGMIHENLNLILQLKTQLKLANELISEKDAIIGNVISELQTNKSSNVENGALVEKLTDDLVKLKAENESMSSRQSHLETALKQITEMKMSLLAKNTKIEELENEISSLTKKKNKTINTKKAEVVEKTIVKPKMADDF